jgi:subtilisin family serine protease
MKRLFFIAIMALMAFPCRLTAQGYGIQKISADLQETWSQDAEDTMYPVVILMREQFDAKNMTRQMQHLNKAQKRELVVKELQRISQNGQKSLLNDLQQGQRAHIVDNIKSFWIFNGICCTTTKEMILAIAERPDVGFVMKEQNNHIPDGDSFEEVVVEKAENQWNVNKVNAPAVWNLGYTGKGVIVAVIDTGINYNHTDIKDNMWDGGEDFPYHGWDFINNDNDPMDDHSHGTHCAGTVSSYGTNGWQCGIAKDAKIMALKALSAGGSPQSAAWASIEFAISHGADILSMSFGSSGIGGYWADRAVMENVLHCGVVASVAAGNDGANSEHPVPYNVNSPGSSPSPWQHPDQILSGGHTATITVGSVDSNDTRAASSSRGPSTWTEGTYHGYYNDYPWTDGDSQNIGLIKPDIAAPGVYIYSLDYSGNTGYSRKSGTSMATPCVAGVMALMLEANPSLSPLEIDSIIETTAVACGGQTSKNNYYGSGRIDALAAINYMLGVCDAPTNLSASVTGFDVTLLWDGADNVDTYRVYRNNAMIASSVSGTTYIDENAPAGNNTYYVRSNGNNGQASLPSNEVTATVAASHTPIRLEATEINTTNRTVELRWNQLYYGEKKSFYYNVGEPHIAAQVYPTSILQSYAGMQIECITFIGAHAESEFTIRLYEGDVMMPGVLVYSGSITTTEDNQQIDYVLTEPLPINPNKTLWLTIETSDMLMAGGYDNPENSEAFLLGFPDDAFWVPQSGYSWSFRMSLSESDGYKHKLYCNGTAVASNIDVTHHTAEYIQGVNNYQVSTYTDGYESSLSNSIILVDSNGSSSNLILDENDQLYGLPGSCLTVSGDLSNSNPKHLILEDGAQLINDSEGVQATVKKAIQPYTEGNRDGWNLIASPVIESLDAEDISGLLRNEYDLYAFNQSGTDAQGNASEWRNYKAESFTTIDPKVGYLYANSGETTLSFVGTLPGIAGATGLAWDEDAYFAGFNLIGNPYPCNAYLDRSFYVLEYDIVNNSTKFVLGENPIAPCTAVLVQAQTDEEVVTFSKTAPSTSSKIAVRLNQADQKGTTDIDQVRIMFQQQSQLAKYPQESLASTIYIPQNGKRLAVANAEGLTELPINLRTAKNGSYTLSIETEKLDLNYLHLIDNMTGDDVDLLNTPSYTFNADVNDHEWRFRLVFSNCEDAVDYNEVFAYVSNGEIVINGVETCHGASLQIIDMMGHVLVCKDVARNVSTREIPAGVYVLRLINGDDVKTQKIVIE